MFRKVTVPVRWAGRWIRSTWRWFRARPLMIVLVAVPLMVGVAHWDEQRGRDAAFRHSDHIACIARQGTWDAGVKAVRRVDAAIEAVAKAAATHTALSPEMRQALIDGGDQRLIPVFLRQYQSANVVKDTRFAAQVQRLRADTKASIADFGPRPRCG